MVLSRQHLNFMVHLAFLWVLGGCKELVRAKTETRQARKGLTGSQCFWDPVNRISRRFLTRFMF